MTKRSYSPSVAVKRTPIRKKIDLPYFLMGMFFVAMAVFELMFPENKAGGRSAIKYLCGAQIVFALIISFLNGGSFVISGWVPFSFLSLLLWIVLTGIMRTTNLMDTLYLWTLYFYWYSMFSFFYIRTRIRPFEIQGFIVIVVFSLLIWLPALMFSTENIMIKNNLVAGHLRQNNIGYYIVALFPYVLMLRRKVLKIIGIALITYGALYSLKRGAILALILMGMSSTFLYLTFITKEAKIGKRIAVMIILWVTTIIVGGFFVKANQESIERRLNEGHNREGLYMRALKKIGTSEIYELVIGHGDRRAQKVLGGFTHNDWLMLAYDYGIIGVLLMLNVYASLAFLIWKLCKLKSPLLLPLTSAFILMACVQMYSIGLQLKTFGIISGSIGIVVGSLVAENRLRLQQAYKKF